MKAELDKQVVLAKLELQSQATKCDEFLQTDIDSSRLDLDTSESEMKVVDGLVASDAKIETLEAKVEELVKEKYEIAMELQLTRAAH